MFFSSKILILKVFLILVEVLVQKMGSGVLSGLDFSPQLLILFTIITEEFESENYWKGMRAH